MRASSPRRRAPSRTRSTLGLVIGGKFLRDMRETTSRRLYGRAGTIRRRWNSSHTSGTSSSISTGISRAAATIRRWIYALLFLIVFCETGLVVTPFLPGDSLLFVAGALWAAAEMDARVLAITLIAAALCGDNVNYWVGRYLGPKVFRWEGSRLFNRRALDQTHAFYERHGGKTIIMARFVPLVRTFAPFVAGVGAMGYPRFFALAWRGRCFGLSLWSRPAISSATCRW